MAAFFTLQVGLGAGTVFGVYLAQNYQVSSRRNINHAAYKTFSSILPIVM